MATCPVAADPSSCQPPAPSDYRICSPLLSQCIFLMRGNVPKAGLPQQRHTMAACRAAQCQPPPATCRHACKPLDSIVLVCGFFCGPGVMHFLLHFSLFSNFFVLFLLNLFKMALRWHSGSARCFVQTTSGRFFLHRCMHETTLPHLFISLEHETRHFIKRSGAKLACGRPCGANSGGSGRGYASGGPAGQNSGHRNGEKVRALDGLTAQKKLAQTSGGCVDGSTPMVWYGMVESV